jgi:hypothetical protein
MKKKPVAEAEKNAIIRSSITVSSKTVCEDEACIGKIANDPTPTAISPAQKKQKHNKASGTTMSFGGKHECTDEACIGKS